MKQWNSAMIMSGTAIEQALKDKANSGDDESKSSRRITLAQRIDKLEDIPKAIKELAHHVRLLRNEAAHETVEDAAKAEELANEIVEYAILFLDRLYVLPARESRLKERIHDSPPSIPEAK